RLRRTRVDRGRAAAASDRSFRRRRAGGLMTAAVRPFALAGLAPGVLTVTNGCAPKVTTPAPVAASPRFPDFVFPDPPAGLGTPATVERHKAGWQWLQAGDFRGADRIFAPSLKL